MSSGRPAYIRPEGAIRSLITMAPRFLSGCTPRHQRVMHDPVPVALAEKRFWSPLSSERHRYAIAWPDGIDGRHRASE